MNDLISRQAAIDALNEEYHGMISDESMKIYKIIEWLGELPSAQPEVIHCRECGHHHYEKDIPYCDRIDYGYGWKDNDFCSRAERREE